jgi:transporter family protein
MVGTLLGGPAATVPGELVALLAALLSSFGYVAAKQGLSDASPEALVAVTAGVSVVVLTPYAIVTGQTQLTPAMTVVFFLSGLLGTGLGRFLLSNAIDLVGAGIAHSVKSASPVVAVVFAVAFLGESLTVPLSIGIMLVVGGLVILTRSSNEANESIDPKTAALVSLVIVIWFGATPVVRKFGLSELGAPLVPALALNFAVGLAVGVIISAYRDTGQLRAVLMGDSRWYLLATGLCWTASISTYFFALSLADAVVVVPIFNSSPLFTVALGLLLFKGTESPTRATLAGATITVCGVILITVG